MYCSEISELKFYVNSVLLFLLLFCKKKLTAFFKDILKYESQVFKVADRLLTINFACIQSLIKILPVVSNKTILHVLIRNSTSKLYSRIVLFLATY